jgi:TetR/AcrR family transcriptional regulator, mexJK operon transcriptional repressor
MDSPSQAEPLRARAGRPTKAQAVAREAELLDAALDLFLEQGYALTTIEGVAAALGMTKRTIYARHADKAALFKATVRRAIQRAAVEPEAFAAVDTGELESTLLAFARMRVAHVQSEAALKLQRIINAESYRFPEIFAWYAQASAGPPVAFLTQLLARHAAAGELALSNPGRAAMAFMSLALSGPARSATAGSPLGESESEERIAFAVQLFLNGARTR